MASTNLCGHFPLQKKYSSNFPSQCSLQNMLYIYFSDRTFCIAPKGKIAAFGNYQVKKTRSLDVDA